MFLGAQPGPFFLRERSIETIKRNSGNRSPLARSHAPIYLSPMALPTSIPRRTPRSQKPAPRCATVLEAHRLSPNMQRVILGGDIFDDFPPNRDGANLKIVVPNPGQDRLVFEADLETPGAKKTIRTFTISKFDPQKNQLTIDFALHDGSAPAGDWAKQAEPEKSFLGVTTGGAKKVTSFWGKRHLLAADMTAIPAMEALLRDLPTDAQGEAVFEVLHANDIREIHSPEGIRFHWLINPDPQKASQQQIDAIRALTPDRETQISAAGEHSVIAEFKTYFGAECGFDLSQHYLSPYWKIGLHEEEHQALKREEQ